jgi:hypothetical protein
MAGELTNAVADLMGDEAIKMVRDKSMAARTRMRSCRKPKREWRRSASGLPRAHIFCRN